MTSDFKKYYIALPKREETVVNTIIANELSDIENYSTKQYLLKDMTQEQIALDLNISQATVNRAIDRAKKKIYNYMKYVEIFKSLKE